jgi:hypothetical protein
VVLRAKLTGTNKSEKQIYYEKWQFPDEMGKNSRCGKFSGKFSTPKS